MTEITSSHNEQLKEIRKLAGRRWRDKLGEFVAEGEDLLEAADAAGWHASARYAATGSGLPGVPVAPHVLADVSQLGSGTRTIGVYPQRWSAAVGPALRRAVGRQRPGQRRHGDPQRAGLRRVLGRARPRQRRSLRPQGRARLDGRAVQRPGRARAHASPSCPAGGSRSSRATATPLHELAGDGELTLVVGAEREGLPDDVLAACDDVAHIPIAHADSLNAAMAATVALYELN